MARVLSLTYDRLTAGHLYDCRGILEKTQWMKKTELQRLQLAKLKVLLKHAYENVPYYHELFRNNAFRPADFNRLEDLQKVPVLHRSELRLKHDLLIARNHRKSELVASKTSGTTATPIDFYRDKRETPWNLAAQERALGWAGYETGAKLVYVRIFEPHDQLASARQRLQRTVKRWRLLGGYGLSEESMEEFCMRNRNFKPDYVHGGACTTNIFASFLLENSSFKLRPKAVFTYGETLLPHYRKTIEEAFKCRVHDFYSSTEVPYTSAQCGHHEAHHVTDENFFLETEKDGEPAASGEEGRVLLTSLNGLAMPFIRYDIGDRGKKLAEDCPCGRGLSLFKPVGRTYEYFVHSDGTFTIFRDLQTLFEDLPVEDYQIMQQNCDEIVAKIVKRPGYTKTDTDFILKKISLCTSNIVKVRVELAESLPLTGFGKASHFVSKIPTKYTQT